MPNMRGRGGKKRGTFSQKRGVGRGRGGVSHRDYPDAGARRFGPSQEDEEDDVVLLDEEGNDQPQQNADLRSVLNERR